ncbi:hypothetical protein, partial [Polaromonas sp.]|uniref:hypothetical protein n=1 Tax=Polaromonas sp. TaxID=1869339 RepID=UPI0025D1CC51
MTQVLYSGLGGHASVAFSLLAGDIEGQWQPALLFVGIEPLAPGYRQLCELLELPFECIQSRQGQPWCTWPAIYLALRRQRPDVVVLHSVSSLLPVALYCFTHRKRLVDV